MALLNGIDFFTMFAMPLFQERLPFAVPIERLLLKRRGGVAGGVPLLGESVGFWSRETDLFLARAIVLLESPTLIFQFRAARLLGLLTRQSIRQRPADLRKFASELLQLLFFRLANGEQLVPLTADR